MRRRLTQPADLGALSGCASALARAFVSLDSDIAIVVDDDGIVTSVAQHDQHPMDPAAAGWVGRAWALTASGSARRKIECLLADTQDGGRPRRREVNHAIDDEHELPVSYTALRLGTRGPVLAVGRDLRRVAALQQRCLSAQQAQERLWWGTRHDIDCDRQLQRIATDALLVVDTGSLRVLRANAAAGAALRTDAAALGGLHVLSCFDARTRPAAAALLAQAAGGLPAGEAPARLAGSHRSLSVVVAPCEGGDAMLLRLRDVAGPDGDTNLPPIVVSDGDGLIRHASARFAQWAAAATPAALQGQPLARWLPLATPSRLQAVRAHGLLSMRGALHGRGAVDMEACLALDGEPGHCNLILHPQAEGTTR